LEETMNDVLIPCIRVAGIGLLALAVLQVPIARRQNWRGEASRMSPFNASVFLVHAFFIGVVLVAMGLPCVLDPTVFLDHGNASAWASGSMSVFWVLRLWVQWFVYDRRLWRGKRLETVLHWWFTLVWLFLTGLFGLCAVRVLGWIG
jgi:hypothetical protein